MSRRLPALAAVLAFSLSGLVSPPATDTAAAAASKTTVCHRTRSTTNPYRRITVAQSSLTSNRGHKNHTGPVWVSGMISGSAWGDIIPDAANGGTAAATLNFVGSPAGQALWHGTTKALSGIAGCRYQTAKEFYDIQKAAGATDEEIVADLNEQGANEDAALLAALGGSFTVANLGQLTAVSATTTSASAVTATTANVGGDITLGAGTTAALSFRYGLTPDLSGATSTVGASPAAFTASSGALQTTATANLTSLSPDTTYYFRFIGTTNAGTDFEGTVEGTIRSFTTASAADVEPTPTPTPTPVVEPTPTPTPVVEPTPTPTPVVEPTPTPTPRPDPSPVDVPPAPHDAAASRSILLDGENDHGQTSIGPLVGIAAGRGGMTVAQLSGVPDVPAPGAGDGHYFSIAVGAGSGFDHVEFRVAGDVASSLLWWDGAQWRKLRGTIRDAGTGELVVRITAGSSPGLSDLADLRLAAGETPAVRLAGADRRETAAAASQAAYPARHSAGAVVLARDDLYADALTGGPLAAAESAPLLLSNSTTLSPTTAAELQRVLPHGGTVFLLGGEQALSPAVAARVADLGYHVERVAGANRYDTAVRIAARLGHPGVVFEATGQNFPDAMAAGPAAISSGGAVLLTEGKRQSDATRSYLAGRTVSRYSVGAQAAAADPAASPLVGRDRFATSAAVADAFFDEATGVGVAVGDDFADSVVAAPYLGRSGQPLLLVGRDGDVTAAVGEYLMRRSADIGTVTVFGGGTAVSDTTLRAVQRRLP